MISAAITLCKVVGGAILVRKVVVGAGDVVEEGWVKMMLEMGDCLMLVSEVSDLVVANFVGLFVRVMLAVTSRMGVPVVVISGVSGLIVVTSGMSL